MVGAAELARLVAEGKLDTVKGIGEALAQKITELHTTGWLDYLTKLRAPLKGFYTFDESAHSPLFEEPAKLRRILAEELGDPAQVTAARPT